MSRDAATRRVLTLTKINQRKAMFKKYGSQGGTLYEKHIAKIDKSGGYMRDGNVSHYVAVGFGEKTNNRGNYGKNYNPSIRDQKSNINAKQQLSDLNEGSSLM